MPFHTSRYTTRSRRCDRDCSVLSRQSREGRRAGDGPGGTGADFGTDETVVFSNGDTYSGEWKDGKPIVKDAANQSPDFLAWLNDSVGAVAGPRRNREYQSVSQQDDD